MVAASANSTAVSDGLRAPPHSVATISRRRTRAVLRARGFGEVTFLVRSYGRSVRLVARYRLEEDPLEGFNVETGDPAWVGRVDGNAHFSSMRSHSDFFAVKLLSR